MRDRSRLIERLGACTLIVMVERTHIFSDLCRAHDIEILYAFGSRAQEMADWVLGARPALIEPASDMDIGVKPKKGKSFSVREKSEIAVALEDVLLVHRIDLVVLPEADPFLAANIMRDERLFPHDAHAADEYELYILRRAGKLAEYAVLSKEDAALLKILAGYPNRLEHFYHEISTEDLYQICSRELGDVVRFHDDES